MDSALLLLKDNAVAVGVVLTIVGLIGGAIGASVRFLIDNKKIENDKKALRQQMITNNIAPMRQAWINDFRKNVSDILTSINLLHELKNSNKETKIKIFKDELDENMEMLNLAKKTIILSYEIQLLLSTAGIVNDDLVEKIELLADNIFNTKLSRYESNSLEDKILAEVSLILNSEWEIINSLKEME